MHMENTDVGSLNNMMDLVGEGKLWHFLAASDRVKLKKYLERVINGNIPNGHLH